MISGGYKDMKVGAKRYLAEEPHDYDDEVL